MIWLPLAAFIITNFTGSDVIAIVLGMSVSDISFSAVNFGGCLVWGLELVSNTSYLLVIFGRCGGILCGNMAITVSVMLAVSATSTF